VSLEVLDGTSVLVSRGTNVVITIMLAQAVIRTTCIREVLGSYIGWDTTTLRIFVFASSLLVNVEVVL
jgi:hypothetical protein